MADETKKPRPLIDYRVRVDADGLAYIDKHVLRSVQVYACFQTKKDAHDAVALLRFASAMTPEMWNALDDASANVPPKFRHKLADLVGARQALDDLRQALQQGRQG